MKKSTFVLSVVAVLLVLAFWAKSESQTTDRNGQEIAYETSLVAVGEPFIVEVAGDKITSSSDDWSLKNFVGGKSSLEVNKDKNVVTVMLTVTEAPDQEMVTERVASAPMISWNKGSESLNIPLTIVGKSENDPEGTTQDSKPELIHGKWGYRVPSSAEGDWFPGEGPVAYVPTDMPVD